MTPAVVVAES